MFDVHWAFWDFPIFWLMCYIGFPFRTISSFLIFFCCCYSVLKAWFFFILKLKHEFQAHGFYIHFDIGPFLSLCCGLFAWHELNLVILVTIFCIDRYDIIHFNFFSSLTELWSKEEWETSAGWLHITLYIFAVCSVQYFSRLQKCLLSVDYHTASLAQPIKLVYNFFGEKWYSHMGCGRTSRMSCHFFNS